MPTTNQLVRKGRKKRRRRRKTPALGGRPMIQGVVTRTYKVEPRRPNSGKRKVCRVKLRNGARPAVFIPGEGHNLREHSVVLVRGGRRPDLPGMRYQVVRGTRDSAPVEDRGSSRSRYGKKAPRSSR